MCEDVMHDEVTITCLAPLSHGGFGLPEGNVSSLRRVAVVSLPGMPRVPVISGNALRGVIRRVLMRDLFFQAGLLEGERPPGWSKLYAALANGGHLVGAGQATVDLDARRKAREELPPLSVPGAALYDHMLPGHVRVGLCWPVCRETAEAGLVSTMAGSAGLLAAEDLVEEYGHARHIDREEQDPAVSGVTPMPTTLEVLGAGTRLESRIDWAPQATEIERAALGHALDGIEWLGAKNAAGLGRVEIAHDIDATPYRQWLVDVGREGLAERLLALAARWAK